MFTMTHFFPLPSTGGGDTTALEQRITDLEMRALEQSVIMDDLGLQLVTLRDVVQGTTDSAGDDPGLVNQYDQLAVDLGVVRTDLNTFQTTQTTHNQTYEEDLLRFQSDLHPWKEDTASRLDTQTLDIQSLTLGVQDAKAHAQRVEQMVIHYHGITSE